MAYKILVVDDEHETRELLKFELERQGYAISTATDGKNCLEKIKKEKFDLVIMDLQMPKLSGLQTLVEMKKMGSDSEVIMMTATATVSTAVESIKIGAYDYIIKPFDFNELKLKIENCLDREIKEKQRILVIDSNPDSANFVKDLLTLENFKVISASDGETAIKKVKQILPDLIIMDIITSGINSWEICRELKDDNRTNQIPIIILTSQKTRVQDEIASLKLGVDDYITRPCDTEILLNRIRTVLRKTDKIKDLKETIALYEITKAIGSLMELDELLNLILKLAVEISESDGGSLMLYDSKTEELEIKTTFGEFKGDFIGKRTKIGERIAGFVGKEKKPAIITGHSKDDPRFKHIESYNGIKSAIVIPMLLKERLIGCINLKRIHAEKRFTVKESNFLSLFASQAALAVENASLHKQIRKHAEELEHKVKERTRELEKANEELKISQKKIVRTEKLRMLGQMATNIAHEFKNYLAIIKMSAEYCLLKLPLDERVKKQLNTIIENEELAYQSVKNLGTFAKPSDIALQPNHINNILDNTCRFLEIKCRQQKVKLIKDFAKDIPTVMIDALYIQSVFMNLIINSLQAMSIGGEIKLETKYDIEKNKCVVKIIDTGCGIPKDKLNKIFDPFFTTKMDGAGLGLVVAKQIVDYHHGELALVSEEGKGTTVVVVLPVQLKEVAVCSS